MLRWLARLFGQRNEAETASAAAPPPDPPPPAATEPTQRDAATTVVEPSGPTTALIELPVTEVEDKETCPVCGRTSVFAGPPGQRFCTYCALRDEIFERSAAATE